MSHTVRERDASKGAWEPLRAVATVVLLGWLGVELWLFAGAAKGPDVFAGRLAVIPTSASLVLVASLVAHVLAGGLLVFRGPAPHGTSSRWVRLADQAAMLGAWGLAAAHYSLFWNGVVDASSPFDAWVRTLGATPGGVPLIAFGYLLGLGACAYATARVVIVAERRGSWLAAALGVALGAVVMWVGGNGVIAVATGAGWKPMAPTAADPCGTP